MKFILGKKLEMSQIFKNDGTVVPVTMVKAGPCMVTQARTLDKDGYGAVQIGFGDKKRLNKPQKGHLKGLPKFRHLVEFRTVPQISSNKSSNISNEKAGDGGGLQRGDEVLVGVFEVGDKVKVSGVSKGKGFQGVVKRHGFHGQSATHGTKDQVRAPGSIGATEPARVFPGMRMPGRMGGEQVTVANLEIAKVEPEKNLIYIKGAVPGGRNGLLAISGEGEMALKKGEESVDEEKREKRKEEKDDDKGGEKKIVEKQNEDGKLKIEDGKKEEKK